jgi:hypothetical protein
VPAVSSPLSRAEATLRTLARELEGPDLDLVMHVGDISYANGNPVIWDSFMDAIEPLTRRVPYMVAIGAAHGSRGGGGGGCDPTGGSACSAVVRMTGAVCMLDGSTDCTCSFG